MPFDLLFKDSPTKIDYRKRRVPLFYVASRLGDLALYWIFVRFGKRDSQVSVCLQLQEESSSIGCPFTGHLRKRGGG